MENRNNELWVSQPKTEADINEIIEKWIASGKIVKFPEQKYRSKPSRILWSDKCIDAIFDKYDSVARLINVAKETVRIVLDKSYRYKHDQEKALEEWIRSGKVTEIWKKK